MNLRVVQANPFCASTPLAALAEDLTPARLFFVRDHFRRPEATDAWTVRVGGRVERPFALDARDLGAEKEVVVTLECAGNGRTRLVPLPPGVPWDDGAVSTARWAGVPLRDVLERARLLPDAVEVVFRGAEGFERSLPVAEALHPDVLLATRMNGEPLGLLHGGPVRLVVPSWYAMASVKWLTDVEVVDRPFEGRFQKDDYVLVDGDGPARPITRMLPKALVTSPLPGRPVRAGEPTTVEGRAWAGTAPVARVEVSTDAGATWREAALGPSLGPYAWRRFSLDWTPEAEGAHVVVARAFDAAGRAQSIEPVPNAKGYANNAVAPVTVTVDAPPP